MRIFFLFSSIRSSRVDDSKGRVALETPFPPRPLHYIDPLAGGAPQCFGVHVPSLLLWGRGLTLPYALISLAGWITEYVLPARSLLLETRLSASLSKQLPSVVTSLRPRLS